MNRCGPRKNNSTLWKYPEHINYSKLQSKNQEYGFDVRLLTTVATKTAKKVQFPKN